MRLVRTRDCFVPTVAASYLLGLESRTFVTHYLQISLMSLVDIVHFGFSCSIFDEALCRIYSGYLGARTEDQFQGVATASARMYTQIAQIAAQNRS